MNWVAINGTNATIANQISTVVNQTSSAGTLPIMVILFILIAILYWRS